MSDVDFSAVLGIEVGEPFGHPRVLDGLISIGMVIRFRDGAVEAVPRRGISVFQLGELVQAAERVWMGRVPTRHGTWIDHGAWVGEAWLPVPFSEAAEVAAATAGGMR
ncbi:hypothetical protein [Nocardia wallacei]|uniref:hypothetical protein n=1 Tax=Nocardia wallacei TaxID=480035 RepID=UPI0024538B7E|nr:hypothetical protein [Nocardia wallacei]